MRKLVAGRVALVREQGDDRGVALVAAIGVMIIALSLGALVVSQAVMSQRDSGRNRARTVEIHSAEAGVDTLYANLQKGVFPKNWEVAEGDRLGPDEVGAEAIVRYWDEDGVEMTDFDASGQLVYSVDRMPARARILVTSENAQATMAGIEPERSFESEVLLHKDITPRVGAAIFSASQFTPSNNTAVLGDGADVWVDTGSYLCSNSTDVHGNIYVPGGGVSMANGCHSVGSVEARDAISMQNNAKIDQYARSKNGGLTMSNNSSVELDAELGGSFSGSTSQVRGNIYEGHTFDSFHQSAGLPKVYWNPSDWTGFTEKTKEQFASESMGDLEWWGHPADACALEWYGGTIKTSANDSIIDLTACSGQINMRGLTIELYGDTALFAKGFQASNGLTVKSGDGGEHALWLIVPYDTPSCSGIHLSGRTNFSENAPVFFYAPCAITLTNNTDFYGQAYGDPVDFSNNSTFTYKQLGIPGVDMMPGYVEIEGNWDVDVVYKRETGDRVN